MSNKNYFRKYWILSYASGIRMCLRPLVANVNTTSLLLVALGYALDTYFTSSNNIPTLWLPVNEANKGGYICCLFRLIFYAFSYDVHNVIEHT